MFWSQVFLNPCIAAIRSRNCTYQLLDMWYAVVCIVSLRAFLRCTHFTRFSATTMQRAQDVKSLQHVDSGTWNARRRDCHRQQRWTYVERSKSPIFFYTCIYLLSLFCINPKVTPTSYLELINSFKDVLPLVSWMAFCHNSSGLDVFGISSRPEMRNYRIQSSMPKTNEAQSNMLHQYS